MTQTQPAKVIALPERELSGPEVWPILVIHRHGGLVSFHRDRKLAEVDAEDGEKFENLLAVRSEHVQRLFGELRAKLDTDAYFSLNSFWDPNPARAYMSAAVARKPDKLQYLTCAYVDIDCHKVGIDFGTALGQIITLQDEGQIPPASVIVRSGRGAWLLWLLHDAKDPSRPQRAFADKIMLHLATNRAIGERLAHLGADPAARDPVRTIRVPGSLHSGAGRRVAYWLQCGGDGQGFSYSLPELAEAFGAEVRRADPATERALRHAEPGKRPRGYSRINAQRLADFAVLRQHRGGFSEGHRNRAALLFATLLRRSRMDRDHAQKQVERLANECRPPLDVSSCRAAVNTAFRRDGCYLRDATISDWLDVQPAEAELLERLPAASRFQPRVAVALPIIVPPGASARRALIREIVAAEAKVPPCRAMAQMLAARGIEVSHVTVAQDYRALGFSARPEIAKRVVPITCGEKCNLSVGG